MLIKVEWPDAFHGGSKEKWEGTDWEEVQKYHPLATGNKPKDPWDLNHYFDTPTRLTDEEILNLQRLGFELKVMPYPGAMITKMSDRNKWEYDAHAQPEDLLSGKAVQVSIPDMALLYINEVIVETDLCTDQLQTLLDDGWRMLAVCPPNAQRRPDYVLGRVKPREQR